MCHGMGYVKGCKMGSWNDCASYGFCDSAYVGSGWCDILSWRSACWDLASSLLVLSVSLLLAQHSVVVIATACMALLTFSWTFTIWMGVSTLIAARFGFGHCIYVQGGGGCSDRGQISMTPLLSFLVLLTASFKHLTMGEEGIICELGLVL